MRVISAALNLVMAAIVLLAWARMAFQVNENGVLTAAGLKSMKFFTVLSNLLQGVASVVYAVCLLRGGAVSPAVRGLKYAAVVSVALTFFTVAAFLGPVFGFKGMYTGSNLWFHLVVPVLAMVDFCLLDRSGGVTLAQAGWAMAPMLLYGVGYTLNLLIHGVGEGKHTNDWYGFARGGLRGAAVSFAVVTAATFALALLLRLPRRG